MVNLLEETDAIVIPVKTKGRTYGILSRIIAAQGIAIPVVPYRCVQYVKQEHKPDIIFLAFWDDADDLSDPAAFEEHVHHCTEHAVTNAGRMGVRRLALPVLGGKRGVEGLPAMALGIEQGLDTLDVTGLGEAPDDIIIVTDKTF